jgi:hypothetical protein
MRASCFFRAGTTRKIVRWPVSQPSQNASTRRKRRIRKVRNHGTFSPGNPLWTAPGNRNLGSKGLRLSHPILFAPHGGVYSSQETSHGSWSLDRNELDSIEILKYFYFLTGFQAKRLPDLLRDDHLELGRDGHDGQWEPEVSAASIAVTFQTLTTAKHPKTPKSRALVVRMDDISLSR